MARLSSAGGRDAARRAWPRWFPAQSAECMVQGLVVAALAGHGGCPDFEPVSDAAQEPFGGRQWLDPVGGGLLAVGAEFGDHAADWTFCRVGATATKRPAPP